MKKQALLLSLLFCWILNSANAQQGANTTTQTVVSKRKPPGADAIVKDSTGMRYPYAVWFKMLTSGDYSLRSTDPVSDSMVYFLVKRSRAVKEERLAQIPKPGESKQFISGTTFSPFKERDMNNVKLDLNKMTGKVIVLNFGL